MGSVAPGNVADLVLLGANPLAAITNTQRVEAVMHRGRLIDRAGRAALLAEGRRRAR